MNISAYGLYPVAVAESPYGARLHQCDSIRSAIESIPEDERDDWYLPNIHAN